MLVPLSWLKEFVEIDVPVERLAERLTLAGLEVAHLIYIGVPQQEVEGVRWPKSHHLVWDRERILLGAIREVKPHPDADRLVLAMVDYGGDELEQCVTGAPNLFEYKDKGPLEHPLWTAFAAEGAEVWDGHSDEPKRMILKGRALRGIYNKSMVCSEKELGISDEHEGVILMHEDPGFPPGTPLADVLGDVIMEIELTPNLARCFSILGVAREVAALLDKPLKYPSYDYLAEGAPIDGAAKIEIQEPGLNPRFTLALLRDTVVKSSPEWMQRRLRAVGQRPINNIVDVTNYITFELGQPLHAFDYDKLLARNNGNPPTIITRLAQPGETLETLDEVKRTLDPHNILVCDTQGILSMGGIIGGAETEIDEKTKNVLLEAANWNFINIRRSMQSQKVFTDAGTRFSRGVHPSQAILGVQRGIELMRQTGGGQIAQGIIDEYPAPPPDVRVSLPITEIQRLMGMTFTIEQAADILLRLEFDVTVEGDTLHVIVPDHRMDISDDPIIGQADLIEEIARIHGYDAIPNTIMADAMPPQWANIHFEREEQTRDLLVALGMQENISYRFTTPEREAQLIPAGSPNPWAEGYVTLANPISSDKTVLRHTILISMIENAINNARYAERQMTFEIGSVYIRRDGQELPDEPRRLGLLMMGNRAPQDWMGNGASGVYDFYDLKGIVENLLAGLHIPDIRFTRANHPSFHPGRSAIVKSGEVVLGTFGELHPLVARAFDLKQAPVIAGEFDLEAMLNQIQEDHVVRALPLTPPVLEDIALVVQDNITAAEVEAVIRKAGGDLLKDVRLFDVYQGSPIETGYKSLAYSLTYQTDERTLNDKEVAKIRTKIVKAAEKQLGAKLRA
ncbi:MAG: phenylalanine--tRNA ligase subunit beta [Chloroflexi bacterium]|nr:MAG: phenylalanine--tRNA ligase subunit beta [Chloroflexota bacterium]